MNKIAVYFPGIGYHCDKPLLYYSRKIACEKGFENYINVDYSYRAQNIRGNHEKMMEAFENLYAQAEKILEEIEWNSYDEILFVSKSIGTIIAAAYAQKHSIQKLRNIIYTPLVQTFDFEPQNAITFIGSADAWSNANDIIRLSNEKKIPIEVYENCNHSLECDDTLRNIEILNDVMTKTKNFIS